MQGGIRNIQSLKQWFFDVGKPFFTLSYLGGSANQVILRNTAIDEMDEAWALLERQVRAQSEVGRATMQLIVYSKEKAANNPDGRTNIDVSPHQEQQAMAGIGSLQSGGYLDENRVAGMIAEAEEKWMMRREIEDLKAQLEAPNNWTDKVIEGFERIGNTQLGQILAAKLLGAPIPALQPAPITGTPAPADEEGPEDTFDEDIQTTAAILGVDDATLARSLRLMVQSNPEIAKSLLQQK